MKLKKGICTIDGCTSITIGRGWCSKHYNRWRKYGDPTFLARFPVEPRFCKQCEKVFKTDQRRQIFCSEKCERIFKQPKKCLIEDCEKLCDTYKSGAHGYCAMHWKRILRHGSPNINLHDGSGFLHKPSGYWFISIAGKHIKAHRFIMEKHLGRALSPNEHVHHINGNKLDNRIENLQVMSATEHARLHAHLKKK